jgi:lipopolysaccharide/colanic/teichoic acid biosynthesis glycosyltransferase
MKDFQEWIHYDIKYVRELSPGLDLWICLHTAKKMAIKFFSQF